MQEHWLYNYQSTFVDQNFQQCTFLKCVDDNDPILPSQHPRGHAGTGIFWSPAIAHCVKAVPDGGHRMTAVEVTTTERPLCLINVYLPSRGSTGGEIMFAEALDELHEILQKYNLTHDVVIGGDFNSSLHRNITCSRDQILQEFLNEHGLSVTKDYPVMPTFFHTAGDFTSQIDYFFVSESLVESCVTVHDMHYMNLSDHTHISIELPAKSLSVRRNEKVTAPIGLKKRINWGKCDLLEYDSAVKENLEMVPREIPDSGLEAELLVRKLTCVLYNGACVASKQCGRRKKSKAGLPIWTDAVRIAAQESKLAHANWKKAGRPKCGSDPLVVCRKSARRTLRRTIRAEVSIRREL
ncbi:MAG: endonuclease/exonuclease/phosphatase family protein, partial [Candidatus Thiodiazotropha sp.]